MTQKSIAQIVDGGSRAAYPRAVQYRDPSINDYIRWLEVLLSTIEACEGVALPRVAIRFLTSRSTATESNAGLEPESPARGGRLQGMIRHAIL